MFIDAHERADAGASIALAAADIRVTMPPHPCVFTASTRCDP